MNTKMHPSIVSKRLLFSLQLMQFGPSRLYKTSQFDNSIQSLNSVFLRKCGCEGSIKKKRGAASFSLPAYVSPRPNCCISYLSLLSHKATLWRSLVNGQGASIRQSETGGCASIFFWGLPPVVFCVRGLRVEPCAPHRLGDGAAKLFLEHTPQNGRCATSGFKLVHVAKEALG